MKIRILAIMLFIATCGLISYQTYTDHTKKQVKDTHIVVFVHGIVGIENHFNPTQIINFWRGITKNTYYETHISCLRSEPFFRHIQPMGNIGLHKITNFEEKPGNGCGAYASMFDQMYASTGSTDTHIYYTFGWSGITSMPAFEQAGKDLFEQLNQEVSTYKKHGINPKITVIGYSHGGNVIQNLAPARHNHFPDSDLFIDNLVIVCSPFTKRLYQHVNDPMFGTVYNLFSSADRVHRIDALNPCMFACSKMIHNDHSFALDNKVKQIQVKITKCTKNVVQNPKRFAHSCNYEKTNIINGRSKLLVDMSPGHAEMWFFGWALRDIRHDFITSPLPAISFLPWIMHVVEQHTSSARPDEKIVCDIRPQHGKMICSYTEQSNTRTKQVVDIINPKALDQLKNDVAQYRSPEYNQTNYDHYLQLSFDQANTLYYQTT